MAWHRVYKPGYVFQFFFRGWCRVVAWVDSAILVKSLLDTLGSLEQHYGFRSERIVAKNQEI